MVLCLDAHPSPMRVTGENPDETSEHICQARRDAFTIDYLVLNRDGSPHIGTGGCACPRPGALG